jgi:hypothetical protein
MVERMLKCMPHETPEQAIAEFAYLGVFNHEKKKKERAAER